MNKVMSLAIRQRWLVLAGVMLISLAALILLITPGLMLRRFNATLIPLTTAGLSVLWTLGLMSAFGITVNIMTAIIPALLIIVGHYIGSSTVMSAATDTFLAYAREALDSGV